MAKGHYQYNPLVMPDAAEWLAMDEDQRIFVVSRFHRRRQPRPPNLELHALAHMLVENQVALLDPPATAPTIERLQSEGLDRHQAVHAIATVFTPLATLAMKTRMATDELEKAYNAGLEQMTAEKWRRNDYPGAGGLK